MRSAEGAVKFLLSKIEEIDSSLSKEMLHALSRRINERRNITLVSLLLFLHNLHMPKNNILDYSSKAAAINLAKDLYERFFKKNLSFGKNSEQENEGIVTETIEVEDEPNNDNNLLETQLANFISGLEHTKNQLNDKVGDFNKQFKILEGSNSRPKILEDMYKSILTIQPTSTSSERAFSVAALFSTKIRNKLSFNLLTGLVFLKYFFLQKKH